MHGAVFSAGGRVLLFLFQLSVEQSGEYKDDGFLRVPRDAGINHNDFQHRSARHKASFLGWHSGGGRQYLGIFLNIPKHPTHAPIPQNTNTYPISVAAQGRHDEYKT